MMYHLTLYNNWKLQIPVIGFNLWLLTGNEQVSSNFEERCKQLNDYLRVTQPTLNLSVIDWTMEES